MDGFDESTEPIIRIGCFLSVLIVMSLWEWFLPRRTLVARKPMRWTSHLSLLVLNTVLARFLIPISAVSAAVLASNHGWGLLHLIELPGWLEIALAVLVLDLAIYLQHVIFHLIPFFWQIHLVHHADLDFDVTTGLRFHTIEILLSALIKVGVVIATGASPLSVMLFEIVLNATSMFNHSNVRLPTGIDSLLRWFLVTPDMHRVHHSVIREETNSNYGFNLPWWDYLFRTYIPQPKKGHEQMQIGLEDYSDEKLVDRLPGILMLPFQSNENSGAAADESKK